jgi:hypothetical protein
LREIKAAYQHLFGHELAKDISGDTSGTFKALLLDLLEANRNESGPRFDIAQAKMVPKKLGKKFTKIFRMPKHFTRQARKNWALMRRCSSKFWQIKI